MAGADSANAQPKELRSRGECCSEDEWPSNCRSSSFPRLHQDKTGLLTVYFCRRPQGSSRAANTMRKEALRWQEAAQQKKDAIDNAIPPQWRLGQPYNQLPSDVRSVPRTCGILSPEQIDITERTASDLVEQLRSGKISSTKVVEAFCARAAIAQQLVCGLQREVDDILSIENGG